MHSAFFFFFKSLAVKSKIIYYGLKMIMGMILRVIAISNEGQRNSIVTLEGIENDDWEDIATTLIDGSSYILVADTGTVNLI